MKQVLALPFLLALFCVASVPVVCQPTNCQSGLGGRFFTTGGLVEVEILPAEADFTNFIDMFAPAPTDIGDNHEPGKVVALGAFPAGTELVFGIIVRETGFIFKMGPGSRNPDGVPHAFVQCLGDGIANVGFEDKVNSDDPDFDDAVIQIRVNPNPAHSAIQTFQSPNGIASFTACEQHEVLSVCVPVPFQWHGSVRVNYDWSFDPSSQGYDVFIRSIDQSVIMLAAGRPNNPCNIRMGISTDVYENDGQDFLGTIRISRPGSYIFPPTALNFGGIADPHLQVFNPRLTTRAVAIGSPCLGIPSLSWSFDLPF